MARSCCCGPTTSSTPPSSPAWRNPPACCSAAPRTGCRSPPTFRERTAQPDAAAVAAALDTGRGADDPAFAELRPTAPDDLSGAYNKALRKRGSAYLLPLAPETRRDVEWRMFGGSYKGVTDFVTKHLWPFPAFHVVRACAALGITPNMVTSASLVLVFAALWWFSQGAWLPGLLAAWVMTFLDTVDGKLARVTLTFTKFGNLFDHLIDLIHPPFWWLAWIVGMRRGRDAARAPDRGGRGDRRRLRAATAAGRAVPAPARDCTSTSGAPSTASSGR